MRQIKCLMFFIFDLMKDQPIKRFQELQGVSRDHHQALILARKIRQGLDKQVDPQRIHNYLKWFWHAHFAPHFALEEAYIFPILGKDHGLVQTAVQQHRRMQNLCLDPQISIHDLDQLQQIIVAHVRLEERQIFQEIQAVATPQQLELIAQNHHENDFCENTADEFWK